MEANARAVLRPQNTQSVEPHADLAARLIGYTD